MDTQLVDELGAALAQGEIGLQVSAILRGELIVNSWVGVADLDSRRPVATDTLFCPFSVSKAVAATALHVQAERGFIDYGEPVVTYWPEYGRHGKGVTTVRDVLSHRAGVPQMPSGVTTERMCDWDWMVHQIEDLTPLFVPGTTNAYHSLTWGWIVGEIVRRTDPANRSFGTFVREDVCEPLGIADLYFGVPDMALERVARLYGEGPSTPASEVWPLAVPDPAFPCPEIHNRRDVLQAELAAEGAACNAYSMARLFAMLANGGELDGHRLLSAERVESFLQVRDDPEAVDRTRNSGPMWLGVGGYWLGGSPHAHPFFRSKSRLLGHPGGGGSVAWADLNAGLAVAFCHNRMFDRNRDGDPFGGIVDAVERLAAERVS